MTEYNKVAPLTNAEDVLDADGSDPDDFLEITLGRPDFEGAPPNYFLCPLTGKVPEE
jgi:hypothetical protein